MLILSLINYLLWLINGKKRTNILLCGLSGYYSRDRNYNVDKFKILLMYNQTRGTDSVGVYVKDGGLVKVLGKGTEELLPKVKFPIEGKIIIGHNRSASLNTSKKKEDAHPFKFGKIVGAHNGKIDNKLEVCSNNDFYQSDFAVDSEVVFAIMNKLKEEGDKDFIITTLKQLEGPQAFIFTDEDEDNVLYFFRRSNEYTYNERPMFRGEYVTDEQKGFYLSSMKESLQAIGCSNIKEVKLDTLYKYSNGELTQQKVNFPVKKEERSSIGYNQRHPYASIIEDIDKFNKLIGANEPDVLKTLDRELKTISLISDCLSTKNNIIPFTAHGQNQKNTKEVIRKLLETHGGDYERCPDCTNLEISDDLICTTCNGRQWIKIVEVTENDSPFDTGNEAEMREMSKNVSYFANQKVEDKLILDVVITKEDTDHPDDSEKVRRPFLQKDDICVIVRGEFQGSRVVLKNNLGVTWYVNIKDRNIDIWLQSKNLAILKNAKGDVVNSIVIVAKVYQIPIATIRKNIKLVNDTKAKEEKEKHEKKEEDSSVSIDNVVVGMTVGTTYNLEYIEAAEVIGIDSNEGTVRLELLTNYPGKRIEVKADECWKLYSADEEPIYSVFQMVDKIFGTYPAEKMQTELLEIIVNADDYLEHASIHVTDGTQMTGDKIKYLQQSREKIRVKLNEALKERLAGLVQIKQNLIGE